MSDPTGSFVPSPATSTSTDAAPVVSVNGALPSSPSPSSSSTSGSAPSLSSSLSGSNNSVASGSGSNGGWSCRSCTYINRGGVRRCEICSELSPLAVLTPAAKRPLGIQHSNRLNHGNASSNAPAVSSSSSLSSGYASSPAVERKHPSNSSNSSSSSRGGGGGGGARGPRLYATGVEWNCRVCSGKNRPQSLLCSHCTVPRPPRTQEEINADNDAIAAVAAAAISDDNNWNIWDDEELDGDDDGDGNDADDDNDDDIASGRSLLRGSSPNMSDDDEPDPTIQVSAMGYEPGSMLSPEERRHTAMMRQRGPFDPDFFTQPMSSAMLDAMRSDASNGRDMDPRHLEELVAHAKAQRARMGNNGHNNGSSGGNSGMRHQSTEPWSCPACTFVNDHGTRRCSICDSTRPITPIIVSSPPSLSSSSSLSSATGSTTTGGIGRPSSLSSLSSTSLSPHHWQQLDNQSAPAAAPSLSSFSSTPAPLPTTTALSSLSSNGAISLSTLSSTDSPDQLPSASSPPNHNASDKR
jgi:rubrerythrin